MNITLPPDIEERIQEKLRSGSYRTATEVIQAGLEALDLHDALAEEEKHAIRELLDERYKQALDPDTKWVSEEELRANLRKHHEEFRRARR